MEAHRTTTPFGRRTLTLAHVASQAKAKACPPDKTAHKWNVFRDICAAKGRLGVSDRSLAVLNALLSFHPETALSGTDVIVFPSNRHLGIRANGMAPATLRRHLAVLVDAGIIIRRDSPNGKRYARKGRGGEIDAAFGLDLTPMVARADEFAALAETVRADERAVRLLRERITICRRDIAKMIETGVQTGIPAPQGWPAIHATYAATVGRLPRTASRADLEPIAADLTLLAEEVFNLLEVYVESSETSANESQSERHKQNSKPDTPDIEPAAESVRKKPEAPKTATSEKAPSRSQTADSGYSLGAVLDACPDIADFAREGIRSWTDLLDTANLARSALGISPDAWRDAQDVMGPSTAAVTVAAILQRSDHIKSPGGYLRSLVDRKRAGEYSLSPVLQALMRARLRSREHGRSSSDVWRAGNVE